MSPSKVNPDPTRGWIVPVGGAEDKEGRAEILRKFLSVSQGDGHASSSSPRPAQLESTGRRYEDIFREMGAAE